MSLSCALGAELVMHSVQALLYHCNITCAVLSSEHASWLASPHCASKGMAKQRSWVRASEAEAQPSINIRRADGWDWNTTLHKNSCRQDTQICFSLKAVDSLFIGMSLVASPTPPYSNSAKTDSDFLLYYLTMISMFLRPFLLFSLGS